MDDRMLQLQGTLRSRMARRQLSLRISPVAPSVLGTLHSERLNSWLSKTYVEVPFRCILCSLSFAFILFTLLYYDSFCGTIRIFNECRVLIHLSFFISVFRFLLLFFRYGVVFSAWI